MITFHHSPTEKLTDIFGNFMILNNFIDDLANKYHQYEIKMFFSDGRKRKLICNLAAVIKYLSEHDADCIYVYGLTCDNLAIEDKTLIIEKDYDNYVVLYDYNLK